MNTSPVRSPVALSTTEAWALARNSMVGRLAVIVGDRPDIFPVNHVVDQGSIVFRTAEGTKLSAVIGAPVAFEVDGYDVQSGSAWSVVMKGPAHEIRQLDEVLDALTLPVNPWHPGPKPRYVRINPDSVTGIRFPGPEQTGGTWPDGPETSTILDGPDDPDDRC